MFITIHHVLNKNFFLFTFLVADATFCPAASANNVSNSFTDNGDTITFFVRLSFNSIYKCKLNTNKLLANIHIINELTMSLKLDNVWFCLIDLKN